MKRMTYQEALVEGIAEEMRRDDEGLLRFAFLWLRFSLFGEKTMKVKADAVEAVKGKRDKRESAGKIPDDEGRE